MGLPPLCAERKAGRRRLLRGLHGIGRPAKRGASSVGRAIPYTEDVGGSSRQRHSFAESTKSGGNRRQAPRAKRAGRLPQAARSIASKTHRMMGLATVRRTTDGRRADRPAQERPARSLIDPTTRSWPGCGGEAQRADRGSGAAPIRMEPGRAAGHADRQQFVEEETRSRACADYGAETRQSRRA